MLRTTGTVRVRVTACERGVYGGPICGTTRPATLRTVRCAGAEAGVVVVAVVCVAAAGTARGATIFGTASDGKSTSGSVRLGSTTAG